MYGPIANLPGYNPNATYLPPGMAAPSSYPERVKPTQQFYDMAPLPSVVDQSITDLAGGGLSISDPNDSAFGWSGISGGIGGNDALEYQFLNFLAQQAQPKPQAQPQQQMVPPDFSGPSNDQYSGDYLVQPTFGGPQQWNFGDFSQPRTGTVTAQEDGQGVITGQPGTWDYGQPSWPQDYYQSSIPLQPFDIQPSGLTQSQLDQLGQLPSLSGQQGSTTWNTAMNLAGLALPFPFGAALDFGRGAAVGFGGEHMTSDPTKGTLESLVSLSEPSLSSQLGNYIGRQLSPAEESLQKAYSQTDKYDQNTGSYIPGAGSPGTAAAAATPDFIGAGYSGGHTQWYNDPSYMQFDSSGNWINNPYSMTGNMLDLPSWGPGGKFVQGDPNNTD